MGPQFFETVMGKRFFEGQIPKLTRSLERIADALEKQNKLLESQQVCEEPGNEYREIIKPQPLKMEEE